MRKIAKIAGLAVGLLVTLAAPAFAQVDPYVGPREEVPRDLVVIVGPAEGIAVTGANVTVWMLVVAGLVVVGLTALVAARRKARTA